MFVRSGRTFLTECLLFVSILSWYQFYWYPSFWIYMGYWFRNSPSDYWVLMYYDLRIYTDWFMFAVIYTDVLGIFAFYSQLKLILLY